MEGSEATEKGLGVGVDATNKRRGPFVGRARVGKGSMGIKVRFKQVIDGGTGTEAEENRSGLKVREANV